MTYATPNRDGSAYGEREMSVVLEQHRYSLAEIVKFESTNIVAANEDLALFWVIKPGDEFEDCAFPGPVCTHDNLCQIQQSHRAVIGTNIVNCLHRADRAVT